ncbi:hypothetical protein [Burkholderia lata]|uniref:hypothetical protein n=1 Tax=Burkholderia lata (strain ATCC 17760 / DSM 23089 / LMG 22485 / NCIMB 9086 / R18194 / 383) TaxID=482957 RepID=UPI001583FA11|nr:hypothetical protein [Burkholderia lata]
MPYLAVTETARFRRAVFFHLSFAHMTGLPCSRRRPVMRANESWPIGQNRTIRHALSERVVKIAVIV